MLFLNYANYNACIYLRTHITYSIIYFYPIVKSCDNNFKLSGENIP